MLFEKLVRSFLQLDLSVRSLGRRSMGWRPEYAEISGLSGTVSPHRHLAPSSLPAD